MAQNDERNQILELSVADITFENSAGARGLLYVAVNGATVLALDVFRQRR